MSHGQLRLLANENVPWLIVQELRQRGHDVLWIVEDGAGSDDRTVLARATREARLVVTLDKDFGELAFAQRLPAPCGIVLIRTTGASPVEDAKRVGDAIASRSDWPGQFTIIEDDRVRTRPLP